ncbi:hypothetical protein V9T40_000464 [Parthenolecanium corni]|uniref:Uncharacterized protein n=1 Tax=Parthenolecanium corni TaxID=536013 RepID=A0AAN9Y1M7_9HEMI
MSYMTPPGALVIPYHVDVNSPWAPISRLSGERGLSKPLNHFLAELAMPQTREYRITVGHHDRGHDCAPHQFAFQRQIADYEY